MLFAYKSSHCFSESSQWPRLIGQFQNPVKKVACMFSSGFVIAQRQTIAGRQEYLIYSCIFADGDERMESLGQQDEMEFYINVLLQQRF